VEDKGFAWKLRGLCT